MQLELMTKEDLLPIKEDLESLKKLIGQIVPVSPQQKLLKRADICKLLQVSENTLKTLDIPYVKVGNSYRYDIAAVRKHLNLDTK